MMCGNRSVKQIVRGKCGVNSIRNLFPLSGSRPSSSISVVPVFNASIGEEDGLGWGFMACWLQWVLNIWLTVQDHNVFISTFQRLMQGDRYQGWWCLVFLLLACPDLPRSSLFLVLCTALNQCKGLVSAGIWEAVSHWDCNHRNHWSMLWRSPWKWPVDNFSFLFFDLEPLQCFVFYCKNSLISMSIAQFFSLPSLIE